MSSVGLIIAIAIIVAIAIMLYYVYERLPITDCAKYGNPVLPSCPKGKAEYAGLCYTDNWTKYGGTKTGLCTATFKGTGKVETYSGNQDVYNLYTGMSCDGITGGPKGTGWFKIYTIESYSCANGGTIETPLGGYYCENPTIPNTCDGDTDYFEGGCYSSKCPSGYRRSEICTCEVAS